MELNLGTAIRRLRTERGLTQEELADYAGVSFQAVSKWETGTTTPDIALLPRLAVFFGVRIDDLFGITNEDELERVDYILEHEKLTDENFAYAQKVLDKTLANHPGDVRALKTYARLYLAKNQRDRLAAGRMLRLAMEETPDNAEIFQLYRQVCGGSYAIFRSHTDDFIGDCEPYLKKAPDNVKLCELLIDAMIELRYFDRAETVIAVYEPNADNAMPTVFRGDIALMQGDIEQAIEIWNTVDTQDLTGQYEVGERFLKINEYARAETAFERSFASAVVPRDLSAVYSLAFMHERLGNREKAKAMWQRILDVLASDWDTVDGGTVEWAKRERDKF